MQRCKDLINTLFDNTRFCTIYSLVLCFLFGACNSPTTDMISTTTNDMGLFLIGKNVAYVYVNVLIVAVVSLILVAILVPLSFLNLRYLNFTLSIASIVIPFLMVFSYTFAVPFRDKDLFRAESTNPLLYAFYTYHIILSILAGVTSTLNTFSFLYLSSSQSQNHLMAYIIGLAAGPFLTSSIDYVGYLFEYRPDKDTDADFLSMVLPVLLLYILTLVMFLFAFFGHLPFRQLVLAIDDTTVVSVFPTEHTSVFAAKWRQLLSVPARIKTPLLTLLITQVCCSMIYPGFLLFFPTNTFANSDLDKYAKLSLQYNYILKACGIMYYGFTLIATIAMLIIKIGKRPMLSASIFRFIFLVVCSLVTSQYGVYVLRFANKSDVVDSFDEYTLVSHFIRGLINVSIGWSLILGTTQGMLVTHVYLKIVNKIDQNVAVVLIVIVTSISSVIGTALQTALCFGNRAGL